MEGNSDEKVKVIYLWEISIYKIQAVRHEHTCGGGCDIQFGPCLTRLHLKPCSGVYNTSTPVEVTETFNLVSAGQGCRSSLALGTQESSKPSSGQGWRGVGSVSWGICAGVICSAKPSPAAPGVMWAPETMDSSPMDTDLVPDEGVTAFRWLLCGLKCILPTPSALDNGHFISLIRKDYTLKPEL